MTNCCFRVAGNSIFINFVHSSGEYSAILAATRHGGETLAESLKKVAMEIKEVKEILLRNSQTEELQNLSNFLDGTVNFGTHLLSWEIEKNLAIKHNVVYQTFFKNILENVDGISILIRHSSIENAKSLFRVLVENILSLEYLLENDSKNRAMAYMICTFHKEINFLKKMDPQSNVGKEFRAKLKKDRIFKHIPFSDIPYTEKGKQNFEKVKQNLEIPEFRNVEKEYQRTSTNKKNPNWFSLYDGPKDIEQLAKYLGQYALYDGYYRGYSENIHGTNIIKNNLIEDKNGVRNGVMRESQNVKALTLEVLSCLIITYSNFVEKRIPEKIDLYEKWHVDFSKRFDIENKKPSANSA